MCLFCQTICKASCFFVTTTNYNIFEIYSEKFIIFYQVHNHFWSQTLIKDRFSSHLRITSKMTLDVLCTPVIL